MSTADWGPADWAAVAGGAAVILGALLALLWHLPDAWDSARASLRKLPPSDPANRLPYKRK